MAANRLNSLRIGFLVSGLALITRLFYVQIVKAEVFKTLGVNQYQKVSKVAPTRGEIRSSDDFPLAITFPSYLVFADPSLVENPKEESRRLLSLLYKEASPEAAKREEDRITSGLSNPKSRFFPIISQVSSPQKQELETSKLAYLGFQDQSSRFYPEASLSAHLLGFVGKDEAGENKGYFGLEGYYDLDLSGNTGLLYEEKDLLGIRIPVGKKREDEAAQGRTIITSIDRSAQFLVEKWLKSGIEKYGAKSGTVTIMEPQTGRILAMAAFPTYDPTDYSQSDPASFRNPVISDSFEPGSTFKVIAMSAALDEGVVTPETPCDICGGPLSLDKYTIRTWDNKYYPMLNMTETIIKSNNVGMVFAGNRLGTQNFIKYFKAFGFNEATGIDLQDEVAPRAKSDDKWTFLDRSTAMFGQGIAVTPIQMVRAVAAIANGGILVTPKIVDKIVDGDKEIILKPGDERQVISRKTAKEITEMMIQAVTAGEAKWAKPKDFTIAGKTGTAQIPVSGHYDAEKTIASFVGFAPAYEARFVMLVTLREPQTSPWGSETAAPLWFAISRDLFRLWNITP